MVVIDKEALQLIIAPIGDPSTWRLASYWINGDSCFTCCSAIALLFHYARSCKRIHLQLYALDSLGCSSLMGVWSQGQQLLTRESFRKRVESLFREEVVKAAKRMNVKTAAQDDGSLILDDRCVVTVAVEICQASGEYAVNRTGAPWSTVTFSGHPTSIFTKIIANVSTLSDTANIILDLTHGVNYMQSMSIYAVEALKNLLPASVQVFNASPYPATVYQTQRCFASNERTVKLRTIENLPSLKMFNISDLPQLWKLTAGLAGMMLTSEDVGIIRESVEAVSRVIRLSGFIENIRHTALAIYYMAEGAITVAYFNALKAIQSPSIMPAEFVSTLEMLERRHRLTIQGGLAAVKYDVEVDWRFAVPLIMWRILGLLRRCVKEVPQVDDRTTVRMDDLAYFLSSFSSRNPLYKAVENSLRYEKRGILSKAREVNRRDFSMSKPSDMRLLFNTDTPLSRLSRVDMRRHLQAHIGITCEPVLHVRVVENDVLLTLRPGMLGEDPFRVWSSSRTR